ncbi:MAG: hypothetical protein AB7O43_12430 [Hyphomicrobiaceae bacterium]
MADHRIALTSGWARVADYLFGRNALIAIASIMLLTISAYATWAGMHDFIIGLSGSPERDGPGGLAVSHDMLVIVVVIALTFLMWLALRETFGAGRTLIERLITFPLYLFLALWSIGFGYGFWWALIAGPEATRSSIAGLQEDARDAGSAITARLDAVRIQLDSVVSWSDGQMAREETSGSSCGVPSGAGRGPLYNARRSVRDSVSTLRDGVLRSWLAPVQTDLQAMQRSVTAGGGASLAERQRQFEARAADIRGRAHSIAARSNELGRSTAAEMRALAASVSIPPGQTGFSCYDPTLAQRLRQAADQAAQPAALKLREASFNEGPAGTANAIKNLWSNIGAYVSGLAGYVASGGAAVDNATVGGQVITGRDLIALLASIGIDLGIFALALLDPPMTPPARRRRDGLRDVAREIHEVSPDTARQLHAAINTAIARMPLDAAPGSDDRSIHTAKLEWVHRHFIHHTGYSYLVIPNLYWADQDNKDEELRALAMNQLAGVFSDLKLVRSLKREELIELGKEEERDSLTDLTPYKRSSRPVQSRPQQGDELQPQRPMTVPDAGSLSPRPIRNHGLLSKAQRALDIAGWSDGAQKDVELFRLTDQEGLTPLLSVLNDASQGMIVSEQTADTTEKPARARPGEYASQPA